MEGAGLWGGSLCGGEQRCGNLQSLVRELGEEERFRGVGGRPPAHRKTCQVGEQLGLSVGTVEAGTGRHGQVCGAAQQAVCMQRLGTQWTLRSLELKQQALI